MSSCARVDRTGCAGLGRASVVELRGVNSDGAGGLLCSSYGGLCCNIIGLQDRISQETLGCDRASKKAKVLDLSAQCVAF